MDTGMSETLTSEHLRKMLHYEPETGVFRWKVWGGNRARAGSVAGCLNRRGYRLIRIDGRMYLASRLAWLYQTGAWPVAAEMDHKNLNRADDRWSNVREATASQNQANILKKSSNTSGAKGVCWRKDSRKWQAQICTNGKRTYLGSFDTREAAAAVYAAAAKEHFGEFARTSAGEGEA
jgi:hypothetical protein